MKKTLTALAMGVALAAPLAPAPADAQHLRIALREDPDILDPTMARTYVGRIVFTAICDKLFDINERLEIVPQLATGHRWEDPTTLIITLRDSASPDYGSGASVFGVGLVLVLGLGLILLGLVLMFAWRAVAPAFFRGETLHKDTPTVVID